VINVLVIRHARAAILCSCLPLCPRSFLPSAIGLTWTGFAYSRENFASVPIFLFPPFYGTVPPVVHAPLNDRAREDDDDDERKMRVLRQNYRKLQMLRYLSPKRLNIFGLSVTVRKFTSASFRRHSLNLTIDLEIEPRAKLDTMEGLGTSAKK